MTTIGSLFSGIGGLDLGLERAGLGRVVWQAERDTYCQAVLRRHWPNAVIYDDVRRIDERATRVDVLCGGFPCQPVSLAGARLAQADERWLWPEFVRIARALEPAIVVVENVPGLRSAGLRDVLAGLADLGFDAEWTCLAAGENPQRPHGWPHVGAPHERRRLFLVATHPDRIEVRGQPGWLARAVREGASVSRDARQARALADAAGEVLAGRDGSGPGRRAWTVQRAGGEAASGSPPDADRVRQPQQGWRVADERGWASDSGWRAAPPAIHGVDDGLPGGLDAAERDDGRGSEGEALEHAEAPDSWRVSACGNAVVVQCAEAIGRAVMASVAWR